MAFTGYLRAARGERLLGNKTLIESDPCPTRTAAEQWVISMLASNVEARKPVVESGVRKDEGKSQKRKPAKRRRASVETDTDVEREVAEREEANAKSRRGHRTAPGHRGADHSAPARAHAK